MKTILDCDAAYEDIMALLILLGHSDLQLVTVTYGESTPRLGAINIKNICDTLMPEKTIPVSYGVDQPIDKLGTRFPSYINDEANNVLMNTCIQPINPKIYVHNNAVNALYQLLMESEENITVIATGPLTNIATLLREHPHCITKIERIVIMGGAVDVEGNITDLIPDTDNLVAEWNIYADPSAAEFIFSLRELNITLVPIDVTSKMPMKPAFLQQLETRIQMTKEPKRRSLVFVKEMLDNLRSKMGDSLFFGKLQFWDSLSALLAIKPSLAEYTCNAQIKVDTQSGKTYQIETSDSSRAQINIALNIKDVNSTYVKLIDNFQVSSEYVQYKPSFFTSTKKSALSHKPDAKCQDETYETSFMAT